MEKWSRENKCFISLFVLGSADHGFNLDATTLTMPQIKVLANEYNNKQTPSTPTSVNPASDVTPGEEEDPQ